MGEENMTPVEGFDLAEAVRLWLGANGYHTDNFSFRFEQDGVPLDIVKTEVAVSVGPSFADTSDLDDEDDY